jgi:lambda family phage portal protein
MGILDFFRRDNKRSSKSGKRGFYTGQVGNRPLSGGNSGFLGAVQDRLTDDFIGSELSADASAFNSMDKLRARARQLYMSNPYASRYINLVVTQTLGMDGIKFEAQTKQANGELDIVDNQRLELAWKDFSKAGNCSITGRSSMLDIQRLALSTMARDGEVLIRVHQKVEAKYGICLEVMEGDYLLTQYNQELSDGARIRMGIEQDKYGKPIAYHLATQSPADASINGGMGSFTQGSVETVRVPAEEIIHLYMQERPEQSRGITWLAQSMRAMHMTEAYREAELVNARVSASKMAFYTSTDGDGYTGDDIDDDGNLIFEAEAGMIEQLPKGVGLETLDWGSPNNGIGDFIKSSLRGVSAGLNVSYNGLSNDLEGVNFSSIRAGVQDERENWKFIQSFLSEHLMTPLYDVWLDSAILVDAVPFPPRKIEKFRDIVWRPRGFGYVDPAKDNQAFGKAVQLGIMSRTEIASSQGKDFKDVLAQLADEEKQAYDLGVNISPVQTMPIYPAMQDPENQAKGEWGEPEDEEIVEKIEVDNEG